jgi:polar amino acid transport system substrate-binding protein
MPSYAAAQSANELRVAVYPVPPFVMEQNGELTGFNIDLWNAIAGQMNVKTVYETIQTAAGLEDAMRSKKVDIIASPVIVTAARDEEFDFSFPTLQSGLQIMVRETGRTTEPVSPLWDVLALLFSRTTLIWLGIALLIVLIPAHFVWIFERRKKDSILSSPRYFPGIFEAIYWALSCLTTQAEMMPRQWTARIFSIFWMFAGVVFVAFYTAQLTTTLTVQQIRGAINGPEDLPGKRVATLASSLASDYLREHDARVVTFQQTDQIFQALLDKKVDAVVFAAPVLLYFAAHEGKGRVRVVGPEFDTAPVAFVFQADSPWRRRVDTALLTLRENGTYQQLYAKWFGTSD